LTGKPQIQWPQRPSCQANYGHCHIPGGNRHVFAQFRPSTTTRANASQGVYGIPHSLLTAPSRSLRRQIATGSVGLTSSSMRLTSRAGPWTSISRRSIPTCDHCFNIAKQCWHCLKLCLPLPPLAAKGWCLMIHKKKPLIDQIID
jgi:hypothetical protein